MSLLLGSAAVAQQAVTESNLAVLEGRVVNALTKEPVRKAHVKLELSHTVHNSALVSTTDEAGRFRFADISEGQYELTVEKIGFIDGAYRAVKPVDQGSLLRVSGGDQMKDLTLLLFPGGIISGRILDADDDPVPDAEVVLWYREYTRGNNSVAGRTTANQAGEYRLDGLLPGAYYVSASAGAWGYAVKQVPVDSEEKATKVHDLTTFYPAAVARADAQVVGVESGQEQSGIDIRMQRGPTLSVTGRIAGVNGSPSKYSLGASVDDGAGSTGESATILPNGDFDFTDLPPGKHRLTLAERGANGYRFIGKAEVNLTNQNVAGVVITPFTPAQVRVRVVMDSEPEKLLTAGSVFLNPADENKDSVNASSQYQPQEGIYVMNSVQPGKYWVGFNGVTDCYLKSVQSGDQMLDPWSVDVGEGTVLDLLVTFSKSVASLTGDVEVPQDQPDPSVHVVVIQEEPRVPTVFRHQWPQLNQSFHFSVGHMRPGKYLAFAVQEENLDAWNNTDFVKLLKAEGIEVELQEKEHGTAHLRLISKDETDAVRRRLGL